MKQARWKVGLVALLVLACAPRNQPSSRAMASPADEQAQCFGGDPQEVSGPIGDLEGRIDGRNARAPRFQIVDGQLVWGSHWNVGKLDLATRKESWLRISKPIMFMGASHGEAIGVVQDHGTTVGNEVIAVSLATGAERSLLVGKSIWTESLRASTYVVDGDDLYFIRGPFAGSGRSGATFVRLKNRAGEPQVLGHDPDSAYAWFRVHGGFLYWNRRMGGDQYQLSRRALSPDAPVSKLADTHRRDVALAIADGRVYYLDEGVLKSVPLDGSAPPTHIARSPGADADHLLIDRSCAYWTSERGVYRLHLDGKGSTEPEMILNRSQFGGDQIVTDGRHLYWHDRSDYKFKRLARSVAVLPVEDFPTAKPMIRIAPSPDGANEDSIVAVGDGWGCARVVGWGQKHWQCWHAAGAGVVPKGRTVSWLEARELANGPGGLCFLSKSADRCWSWPRFAEAMPENAPQEPEQIVTGRAGQILVGGSFACTLQYVGSERMLQCSGDNTFGQRAEAEQPVMLERWSGAVGTWHGCVAKGKEVYCWGRGDGGQLGFAPAEQCSSAEGQIPCSRDVRQAGLGLLSGQRLLAGDMFTCVLGTYPPRLLCWGASRDGWFGDHACPAQLRERWPTLSGTVGAPQATCAKQPVEVPGLDTAELKAAGHELGLGSRGMCLGSKGQVRCLGAIPSPTVKVHRFKVSPGSRASACGIADDKVLCWGEDYSPASAPGQPVAIAFAATQPRAAVVEIPPPAGKPWPNDKLVHKGCSQPPKAIPPCAPGAIGEAWSQLLPQATSLQGKPIVVRDRLAVGPVHGKHRRWIVLGEGERALRLQAPYFNPGCTGDESLLCCSLPAFGQRVVAKGKLTGSADAGWGIWDAELCEVR